MGTVSEISDAVPQGKTPADWHKFWQKEMEAATKRLRRFRKQGNQINRRFLDERAGASELENAGENRGDTPSKLNLFHKNTQTLMDMLYGQTPRQDVSREHQDPDDDVARVASVLLKRILEADYQPSGEDVATVLKACLQDRLVPGLGIARVRYEVETQKAKTINPMTLEVEEIDEVVSEDVPIEYAHWQDVTWGWGRTWNEIPWWGFRSWLTSDEVKARFGEKIAKNLQYENQLPTGEENKEETFETDQKNNVKKAQIWEIWQKNNKTVYWWSPGAQLILDQKDDPLKLDGFWPHPKPMTANVTTTQYVPKADFVIAQDLYNEVDELQSRISTITRAIKVIGVYDAAETKSVGRMFKEGVENDMIPVENFAMFAEKGGLKGVIDWYPVDMVVGVLQTLIQVQGDKIDQLYEITGMSDIMRGGNTQQYTSDGTNQLKAKMGSISVQALQDEFARFASDLEALKAEVVSKHFETKTIVQQSNAQFMPQADLDKVPQALELIKTPGVKWRVNIRPESIAMIDYAQLKSERTEFLTAMATYIQSAQAAVQQIPGSLPILLEMLKWGMAGFKGSDYLEGTMDQAIEMAKKAPQGGQDDGKEQAKQQETQAKLEIEKLKLQGIQMKGQQEMQKLQLKAQNDMQTLKMKVEGELAKINADHQADMSLEQTDAQNELMKIRENLNASMQEIAAQMEANLAVEQAQSTYAIAEAEVDHNNTMTEMSRNAALAPKNKPSNGEE